MLGGHREVNMQKDWFKELDGGKIGFWAMSYIGIAFEVREGIRFILI